MTESDSTTEKHRGRWLRFSLRTMAVLLTVVCLFLGWIGPKWVAAQREKVAVEKIAAAGAMIQYDYQEDWENDDSDPVPHGAFVLRYLLGEHILSRATTVYFYPGSKPNEAADLLPELTQLRTVTFGTDVKLTDASVEAMVGCENLTKIWTASGVFSAKQLAMLSSVKSIQHLSLCDRSASDACLQQLHLFPNLKSLSIDSRLSTDIGIQAIAEVSSLESLVARSIPNVTNEGITPLHRLKKLKKFHIPYSAGTNQLTEACLPDILKIRSLEDLDLSFYKTRVEFEPAQYSEFESLSHLKKLSLRHSNIQDEALLRIGTLAQLEELNVGWTDITDEGLAHLKNLGELRVLNTFGTRITHEGVRKLEALPSLENIRFDAREELEIDTLQSIGFSPADPIKDRWTFVRQLKP